VGVEEDHQHGALGEVVVVFVWQTAAMTHRAQPSRRSAAARS
jgi:hypothetical protein